jgi:hypothetical protein
MQMAKPSHDEIEKSKEEKTFQKWTQMILK